MSETYVEEVYVEVPPRATAPEPRVSKCPECGNPNPQGGEMCSDCVRREKYDMSGTLRSISGVKVGDEPYRRPLEMLHDLLNRRVAAERISESDAQEVLNATYSVMRDANEKRFAQQVAVASELGAVGDSSTITYRRVPVEPVAHETSPTGLEIDLGAEGHAISAILGSLQVLPDHSKTRVLNAVLNLIPMMEFEGEATFVKPDAAARMAFLREPNNDTSTRAAAFEHLHALMQDDGDGSEGP